MYKTHAKIKWCLSCCLLYGDCLHLGGSVKEGSTVHVLKLHMHVYMHQKGVQSVYKCNCPTSAYTTTLHVPLHSGRTRRVFGRGISVDRR